MLAPLALAALASAARAGEWWVDQAANCGLGNGSAGTPYCTVAEAVAVALPGDTIHVAPGSYPVDLTFWGATLAFVADQGPAVTSLVATSYRAITLNSACDVAFTGFTLAPNATVLGAAAAISDSTAAFTDCVIDGHSAQNGGSGSGGAFYVSNSAVALDGCTFRGNAAESLGGAIYAQSDAAITAVNCLFDANSAHWGEGIFLRSAGSTLALTDCTFTGHIHLPALLSGDLGCALHLEGGTATATGCTFSGNVAGGAGAAVFVGIPATFSAVDSTFDGNSAPRGGAIAADGIVTLERCSFTGNTRPPAAPTSAAAARSRTPDTSAPGRWSTAR